METTETKIDEQVTPPNGTGEAPAPKVKRAKKTPKTSPDAPGELSFINIRTDRSVHLAKDESDPHWDNRMADPPPKWLVNSIDEHGYERAEPVEVTPEGSIVAGRKRWKAALEVDKRRQKRGEPGLEIAIFVKARSDLDSMRRALRENEQRVASDPVQRARDLERVFTLSQSTDKPLSEEELAADAGLTPQKLQEYWNVLALLAVAPSLEDAVRTGKISLTAAAELGSMDTKDIERRAESLLSKIKETGRVTKRQVTDSGEPDRLTAKKIKSLVAKLKAHDWAGKHGEVLKKAAIYALEVVLDARKEEKFFDKLDELSRS